MPDKNFEPKAVSEFLTSEKVYQFDIPSFQRGYRWMPKQVKDLLKDLYDFANDNTGHSKVYYLQPLVVRGEGFKWQVLDGQQRLTTLKLILKALKGYIPPAVAELIKEYEINYLSRPNLDFNHVQSYDNLDSYYVSMATSTINTWITDHKSKFAELSQLANVLFGVDKNKSIKFIWYKVDGEDSSDCGSIAIFNRMNQGKLKLTPSELIKALLIISADETRHNNDFQTVLSMEWNDVERQFMRDDFFAFINVGNKQYDTRTDLLFNYVAQFKGATTSDDDFAYRWFQEKYDNNKDSILEIWENDVKAVFDMLMQWYSEPEVYNYIGFLSQYRISINDIRDKLAAAKTERKESGGQWRKIDNIELLQSMIGSLFKPLNINGNEINYPEVINDLDYNEHRTEIQKILLLFNVITYSKQNLRFPIDKYVDEQWDIEHVDSQTINPLIKNSDQRNWLEYTNEIISEMTSSDNKINELKIDIIKCLDAGIESPTWSSTYKDIYRRALDILKPANPVVDKDALGNLALLDAATNRGYGNALFPYKRKCIVNRERHGGFVPACTRNLFLKYYSGDGDTSGISRMTWSEEDSVAYLSAIRNTVSPIFNRRSK